MFYYNTSIIIIYEKQIFDEKKNATIEAKKENIIKYITTPLYENGNFRLKYWILVEEAVDSESSSDEKQLDNERVDDNATKIVKSKTVKNYSKTSPLTITFKNKLKTTENINYI